MVEMLKAGRPSILTPEKMAEIIAAVPVYIVQTHIAHGCGLHQGTMGGWLARGLSDQNEGIDSIYSQFSIAYAKARAQKVGELLAILSCAPKNSSALTWMLERCFREEFGADSTEIRELRELFFKILPKLNNQGASANDEINSGQTQQNAS